MYFGAAINGGGLILRVQLGAHGIGVFKLYEAHTTGDLKVLANDLDAARDAARFDLAEGTLSAAAWATLSLKAGIRAVTHGDVDYPAEIQVAQADKVLHAKAADGTALSHVSGWFDLGTFKSGPDHYPMFAVYFR